MEMDMQNLMMTGRIEEIHPRFPNEVYFSLRCGQDIFPCVAVDKTAEALAKHCQPGDEISLEGKLAFWKFADGPALFIEARYISFGRKGHSIRD